MDDRERRLGLNEALFREVNERLDELAETFGGDDGVRHDFICECGDPSCAERISLTLDEYNRVRADPTQFAIRPGHRAGDIERVVFENERYAVVRKHDDDAAELAAETDPRS